MIRQEPGNEIQRPGKHHSWEGHHEHDDEAAKPGNEQSMNSLDHGDSDLVTTIVADVVERALPGRRRLNFCEMIVANPLRG
jgi:hypothetical protein